MIQIVSWPKIIFANSNYNYKTLLGKTVLKQLDASKSETPDGIALGNINLSSSCSLESLFTSVMMIDDVEISYPIAMKYLKTLESWKKWSKNRNFSTTDKRFKLNFSFIPPDVGVAYNDDYDPMNPKKGLKVVQPKSGTEYGPIAARMFLARLNVVENLSSVQQLFSNSCAMFTHPWLSFESADDLDKYYRQVTMPKSFWNDLLYENCQVTSSNSLVRCSWHKYNFYGNAIVNFLAFAGIPTVAVVLTRSILNYMQKKKNDNNNKTSPPTNSDGSGGFTNGVPNLPVTKVKGKQTYHPMDARSLSTTKEMYFRADYNPFDVARVDTNAVFSDAQSKMLDLNIDETDKYLIAALNLNGLVTSDNVKVDGSLKDIVYRTSNQSSVTTLLSSSVLSSMMKRVAPRALMFLGLSVPVVNVFAAGMLLYDTYSLKEFILSKTKTK